MTTLTKKNERLVIERSRCGIKLMWFRRASARISWEKVKPYKIEIVTSNEAEQIKASFEEEV